MVCQPSQTSRSRFASREVAITFVTSSMFRQVSGFDGSAHHLPLPYVDSSRAMIVVSSSASFGSAGVTITSDVFSTLS